MKKALVRLLVTLLALALLAGLFVYAGVYNVSARAGHLPVTARFLHFAMRKSARTYAFGIEVPRLDDQRMIVRGATHYAIGCAPCHGEPGNPNPPIVDRMTPPAPRLDALIEDWRDRELFWIVDNGIKYTGMPAWATPARPDEVWSVVAFLKRLPGMEPAAYRRLAYEPGPERGQRPALAGLELDERTGPLLVQCARCHGFDGMGRGTGAFPYLAGQRAEYLYESLARYAAGWRASGIMQPVAAGLRDDALRALARHYAEARPAALPRHAPDPERAARGARIAAEGLPARRVPACIHCHGPGPTAVNPHFPRLAGQSEEYLARQLELWREEARGGGPYAPVMTRVADGLTPAQIRDVAAWYASLPYFGAEDGGAAGGRTNGTELASDAERTHRGGRR